MDNNPTDPNQAGIPQAGAPAGPAPMDQPAAPQAEEKCLTCGNQASGGNCVPCGQPTMSCTCTPAPSTGGMGGDMGQNQPTGGPSPV